MLDIRWFSDPAHAWLCVPMDFIESIPVSFSNYSYRSRDRAYAFLEEDADAGLLLNYLQQNAIQYQLHPPHYDSPTSFIRSYPSINKD